jgi:hypothetical protein
METTALTWGQAAALAHGAGTRASLSEPSDLAGRAGWTQGTWPEAASPAERGILEEKLLPAAGRKGRECSQVSVRRWLTTGLMMR